MPASSHTAADSRNTAMTPLVVVVLLSMLLGIQPVTTDLYLPALPLLTESLQGSLTQGQLTLAALLLAFGVSQLVWGPLSDRFGRRPVLLCGLSIYVGASVGCALAPSMELLVLWRTLQGAAMGAAVVCARALVRDLYSPQTGARVLSKGLTGLGVLACGSAPLGGALSEWFGWRYALVPPAVFGSAAFVLVALRYHETVPHKDAHALRARILLANWRRILRHPTFVAYAALSTASYAGLFTFLAGSSFVLITMHGLTRMQYGLVMFSQGFVFLLGTLMCRRLLARLSVQRTVAVGGALSLSGGTLMGALAWAGVHDTWAIVLPLYLFMLGHGIHQPCGQSGAVGPFPQIAGAASALNGFVMMLAAFGMGNWMGRHLEGNASALTNGLWFWSACIALVAWTWVQLHGDPHAH